MGHKPKPGNRGRAGKRRKPSQKTRRGLPKNVSLGLVDRLAEESLEKFRPAFELMISEWVEKQFPDSTQNNIIDLRERMRGKEGE